MKKTEKQLREKITTSLRIVEKAIESKEDRIFWDGTSKTNALLVGCNNISKIISNTLAASEKFNEYKVYLQRNVIPVDRSGGIESDANDYKAFFNYFCTYFDSKNYNSIHDYKILVNYSKSKLEAEVVIDYPANTKMILIIENFNFYSLNSQLGLVRLSQNPNIMVIGQIRTDLDFAVKHIDVEASTICSYIELDV